MSVSEARDLHRLLRADWALLLPALLAGSSLDAARAWLGYVPRELQEDAEALFQQLQAGAPGSAAAAWGTSHCNCPGQRAHGAQIQDNPGQWAYVGLKAWSWRGTRTTENSHSYA